MKTNQDYKNEALAALKGHWASAVVATLVYVLVALVSTGGGSLDNFFHFSPGTIISVAGASVLLAFFIIGPVEIGYVNSMRRLYEEGNGDLTSGMFGFATKNYLHVVWVYFVMAVKILLWALLLIVPGIIKSFSYAMTPYIMVEHPEYSASEAINASCELMRGHKWELFCLYLSFIGWAFLSVITCCIGFFWLEPYISVAQAAFYKDLKACKAAE